MHDNHAKTSDPAVGSTRLVRRPLPPFWYRKKEHGMWTVFTAGGKPIKRWLTRREAATLLLENWDKNGRTISFS